MRLTTTGFMPADFRAVDDAALARVRAAGFEGCCCFFPEPTAPTDRELAAMNDTLRRAGVPVVQVNGRYPDLVTLDEDQRSAGIDSVIAMVGICHRLEGDFVYVRPGSLNTGGSWWPHPDNHRPETLDRLVSSLRRITPVAEDLGVVLAIEGHVLSPLDTPERVREVIDRVASPALKFNCDPVNFVAGVQDVYHAQRVIDRVFDALGDVTWSLHAKDMDLENRLVLHIEEVVMGTGRMDLTHMLRRFEESRPDGWVIVEHLPDEHIPAALAALLSAANADNISFQSTPGNSPV